MLPEALRLCPVVFVRIPGNQNICLLGSPLLPFSPTAVLASESTASVSVLLARRLGRGSDCGEGRFWLLPTIGLILGILWEYPMPRCAPRVDCQGWCLYTSFTTAWDQKGVCHVEQRLTSTRVLWRVFTLWKNAFIDWGEQAAPSEPAVIIGYGSPSQTTALNRKAERRLPSLQFYKPNPSQCFEMLRPELRITPFLCFGLDAQLYLATGRKPC